VPLQAASELLAEVNLAKEPDPMKRLLLASRSPRNVARAGGRHRQESRSELQPPGRTQRKDQPETLI